MEQRRSNSCISSEIVTPRWTPRQMQNLMPRIADSHLRLSEHGTRWWVRAVRPEFERVRRTLYKGSQFPNEPVRTFSRAISYHSICDSASLRSPTNRFSTPGNTGDKALREGKAFNMEMTEQALISHCSVCGRVTELLELPGRIDKFCISCSADLATVILLGTEIDAATMAGRDTDALVSEFNEISTRMLDRAQSAH